jgi:hypothetical protein
MLTMEVYNMTENAEPQAQSPKALGKSLEDIINSEPSASDLALFVEGEKEFDFYTVYGGKTCFFCPNDSTHTYRTPSYHAFRRGARSDDMRSYKVCEKCLGRCNKYGELPHAELLEKVKQLEDRGSVRGRTKGIANKLSAAFQGPAPLVLDRLQKNLVIMFEGQITEIIEVIVPDEGEGKVIVRVKAI